MRSWSCFGSCSLLIAGCSGAIMDPSDVRPADAMTVINGDSAARTDVAATIDVQRADVVPAMDAHAVVDAVTDVLAEAGTPDLQAHPPFVMVGGAGSRSFSADGRTWTLAPTLTQSQVPMGFQLPPVDGDNMWLMTGLCYGQGRWIAMGHWLTNSLVLTSMDGQTWDLVNVQGIANACAYGNGVWVAPPAWSTDGMHWTIETGPTAGPGSRDLTFGGGTFVTVGDDGPTGGYVAYSRDGRVWTQLAITYVGGSDSNRLGYNSIAYGNGHFIAIKGDVPDAPMFEWDGASDTSFTETLRGGEFGTMRQHNVEYGRHAFYITTDSGIFRRPDGATSWELTTVAGVSDHFLAGMTVTDEIMVNPYFWSIDGATWMPATFDSSRPGPGRIVGTIR